MMKRLKVFMVVIASLSLSVVMWRTLSGFFIGGVSHSFDLGSDDETIVFSADARGGSGIFLMNLKSMKVSKVIDSDQHERTPCISPDLKTICYASSDQPLSASSLYRCRLDGTQITRLTKNDKAYDCDPCFSPGGSLIVFARAKLERGYSFGGTSWNDWDIWSLDLNSGKEKQLTHKAYYQVSPPRISGNGEYVVFSADEYDAPEVFTVPMDGLQPPQRIITKGYCTDPTYSMSDDSIVFVTDRNSKSRNDMGLTQYELWKMKLKTQEQSEMTQMGSQLTKPRVFTARKSLIFLSDPRRDKNIELWQMDPDTGKSFRIAGSDLFHNPLAWRPK